MRLLVDEHGMRLGAGLGHHAPHVRLHQPHAAARGAGALAAGAVRRVLPRHLEIIYEINARFLDEVRLRFSATRRASRACRSSTSTASATCAWRNLACVGSHAINGVAELHSELLKQDVLPTSTSCGREKFSNKTNGVTPRRWLVLAIRGSRA